MDKKRDVLRKLCAKLDGMSILDRRIESKIAQAHQIYAISKNPDLSDFAADAATHLVNRDLLSEGIISYEFRLGRYYQMMSERAEMAVKSSR